MATSTFNKTLDKIARDSSTKEAIDFTLLTYKDTSILTKFIGDQGKILPRRITGNSLKFQRKLAIAVKRARQIALLPYVADNLK